MGESSHGRRQGSWVLGDKQSFRDTVSIIERGQCTSKEEYRDWTATPSSGAAGTLGAMKNRTDEVQWQQRRLRGLGLG